MFPTALMNTHRLTCPACCQVCRCNNARLR
nr:MAG TPA: hypothetical protein [Caudoviricetes sp.]